MALSNLKLASIILGAGSAVTGIGFGVNSYLNKTKEISELLVEDGVQLLSQSGDSSKWIENWKKFISNNGGDSLPEAWTFEDYAGKKKQQEQVPSEFKKACERNSKIKIKKKGEGEYQKVKMYCTKEKVT